MTRTTLSPSAAALSPRRARSEPYGKDSMTQVPTVGDRAEVDAGDHELDRKAWNLPRRPPGAVVGASPVSPRLPGATKSRMVLSGTRMPAHDPNGAGSDTTAQDGLDWQGFRTRFFPGRRRHDFEAITAYAAYKRSFVHVEASVERHAGVADPTLS